MRYRKWSALMLGTFSKEGSIHLFPPFSPLCWPECSTRWPELEQHFWSVRTRATPQSSGPQTFWFQEPFYTLKHSWRSSKSFYLYRLYLLLFTVLEIKTETLKIQVHTDTYSPSLQSSNIITHHVTLNTTVYSPIRGRMKRQLASYCYIKNIFDLTGLLKGSRGPQGP